MNPGACEENGAGRGGEHDDVRGTQVQKAWSKKWKDLVAVWYLSKK